jgi:hypothetical protein
VNQNGKGRETQGIIYINVNADGTKKLNVILDYRQLPEPDANGKINLTGFVNNYKQKATQPDYNLITARNHGQAKANNGTAKASVPKKDTSSFPVDL